jgi:outer membrane protein assembly factor BamB
MRFLALALALASSASSAGIRTSLPPAPLHLFSVAWRRSLVRDPTAWKPVESGGAAVDPTTGLVVAGTRDGWLHAFTADGKFAWELEGDGAFSGQPFIDRDTVYAGTSGGSLYAVGLATGKLRWRYEAKEELGTRPAVADGRVIIASLQDTVFAVDAATGAWRWHHRREVREGFTIRGAANVIVDGGTVYAAYSDGNVAALETGTGKVRWERVVAPRGDHPDIDSIRLDDGRLYAAAFSGAVIALDPATGKLVWQHEVKDASRLTVVAGTIVTVTSTSVLGLSPVDGSQLWSTPLEGGPTAEPLVAGRWLLVPAGSGGLRWLEASSGRPLRVFQPGTGVSAAPGVRGSRVYVLSNGGDLLALDVR